MFHDVFLEKKQQNKNYLDFLDKSKNVLWMMARYQEKIKLGFYCWML